MAVDLVPTSVSSPNNLKLILSLTQFSLNFINCSISVLTISAWRKNATKLSWATPPYFRLFSPHGPSGSTPAGFSRHSQALPTYKALIHQWGLVKIWLNCFHYSVDLSISHVPFLNTLVGGNLYLYLYLHLMFLFSTCPLFNMLGGGDGEFRVGIKLKKGKLKLKIIQSKEILTNR